MTLEQLTQLGRELKCLGLKKHLAKCRELYVVVRDGRGRAEWSLEHAAELAAALQLKPNPLGVLCRGALCPRCCTPDFQPNIAWRTVTHLEDRYVQECTRCGGKWVVILGGSLVGAHG